MWVFSRSLSSANRIRISLVEGAVKVGKLT